MVQVARADLGDGEPLLGGGLVHLAHEFTQLRLGLLAGQSFATAGRSPFPERAVDLFRAGMGAPLPIPRAALCVDGAAAVLAAAGYFGVHGSHDLSCRAGGVHRAARPFPLPATIVPRSCSISHSSIASRR